MYKSIYAHKLVNSKWILQAAQRKTNDLRNGAIDSVIATGLSVDRLSKYLLATGSNLDAALSLYERNTRISESFYTPLQCIEVCLRNRLNQELKKAYGDDWFENGRLPLAPDAIDKINAAKADLLRSRKGVSNGAVVAELSFGFWVGFLGPRYDATLWRSALYLAFSENGGRMKRDRAHGRLNAMRRFRNRIAHHEPIILNDLNARHAEIIEAIGWMCPDTAAWAMYQSRFPAVFAAP